MYLQYTMCRLEIFVFLRSVLLFHTGHPLVIHQLVPIGGSKGPRVAHERGRHEAVAEEILLPSESMYSLMLKYIYIYKRVLAVIFVLDKSEVSVFTFQYLK